MTSVTPGILAGRVRGLEGLRLVWSLAGQLPIPLMLSRVKAWCLPAWPMPSGVRRLRLSPGSGHAEVQWVLWARRFACATRTTADLCCGSHAWCAAACHRIRITSPLPNRVHSDAE